MKICLTVALCICAGSSRIAAAEDKFHVTPDERAACQQDATLLCSYTYPDEDRLVACMKGNKQQLTDLCRRTLETGLKRRHISAT